MLCSSSSGIEVFKNLKIKSRLWRTSVDRNVSNQCLSPKSTSSNMGAGNIALKIGAQGYVNKTMTSLCLCQCNQKPLLPKLYLVCMMLSWLVVLEASIIKTDGGFNALLQHFQQQRIQNVHQFHGGINQVEVNFKHESLEHR